MLAPGCGSDPGPAAPDTGLPAWGTLHVLTPPVRTANTSLVSWGSIVSYAISPRTGRLAKVGTVTEAAGGRLVADPQGRFLFTGTASRMQAYEVNRDGSLSLRADLSFTPYPLAYSRFCEGGAGGGASDLSANGGFLYVARSCSYHNQAWYSLEVLAVGADGSLAVRGSTYVGHREQAGPRLFAEPAGRILYRQGWVNRIIAEALRVDGLSAYEAGEVKLPDWEDFGPLHRIGGSLIATDADGGSVASLVLDEPHGRIDIRSLIPNDWKHVYFVVPFGPSGFLLGRHGWGGSEVARATYEDVMTRYDVEPDGRMVPVETVPDPDRFYFNAREIGYPTSRSLRFHPSWRYAYAATGASQLRAYAAAANGRLTPIQEVPQQVYAMVLTPPLP